MLPVILLGEASQSLLLEPSSPQLEAVYRDELEDTRITPFREAEDEVSGGVNLLPIATDRHLGFEVIILFFFFFSRNRHTK